MKKIAQLDKHFDLSFFFGLHKIKYIGTKIQRNLKTKHTPTDTK